MGKKLYVGNLSYSIGNSELERLFEAHGAVRSAQVITDRDTGRSKGFGFVEMGSDQEAQTAIAALNGKEVEGRALTVNEARPQQSSGGGGYGGGGYGGGKRGGGWRLRRWRRRSSVLTVDPIRPNWKLPHHAGHRDQIVHSTGRIGTSAACKPFPKFLI